MAMVTRVKGGAMWTIKSRHDTIYSLSLLSPAFKNTAGSLNKIFNLEIQYTHLAFTNSNNSSSATVGSLRTECKESPVMSQLSRRQKHVSSSDFNVEESMSGEWTNERHSSYLNSMEAMFVKQLYNHEYDAMDSQNWRSRRKYQLNPSSTDQSNAKPHTLAQFKVFESESWKTCNSVGAQCASNSTNLSNMGPLCKETVIVRGHAMNSNQSPNFQSEDQCQNSSYSYTEVSDQNFVDDEPKQTNHLRRKRTKSKFSNTTFNDQVVPTAQSGKQYEGRNHNTTTRES